MLTPILIGIIIGTAMVIWGALYVWLFRKFSLPAGYTLFIVISFGIALVLLTTVVIQRIRELKEEKDHDFSQY
ncbi:MAG: hypothetical protein GXO90_10840 [FCB group bacterium]|nr:hypothetical protein [FCB group bacterium]